MACVLYERVAEPTSLVTYHGGAAGRALEALDGDGSYRVPAPSSGSNPPLEPLIGLKWTLTVFCSGSQCSAVAVFQVARLPL